MMDTFDDFSQFDLGPEVDERKLARQRLIYEDAALKPWLIGPALREIQYTRWDRIRLLVRETLEAARWSWLMSR